MGDTLQEGKLLLKRGEYEKAANIFQEFLQQRVEEYGELANECGEIYLLYGKALYEIGKVETDTALRQILNIATSKENSDSKSMEVLETIKTGTFIPTVSLAKDTTSEINNNNNNEIKDENEQGEEEETETFELAWQWLDLARIIYSRMIETDPHSLRITELQNSLAECYLILGRIGLETDSPTSIDDLQSCLKIQIDNLSPNSPKLSFTQYQIAIAYQLLYQYEKSLISLQDALSRLEKEPEDDDEEEEEEDVDEDLMNKIKEKIEEVQKLMVPKKSADGVLDTKEENVVDYVRTMIKTSLDEVSSKPAAPNSMPVHNLGVFGKPASKITITEEKSADNEKTPVTEAPVRNLGTFGQPRTKVGGKTVPSGIAEENPPTRIAFGKTVPSEDSKKRQREDEDENGTKKVKISEEDDF